MDELPRIIKIGSAVGIIGGVVCIALLALSYESNEDSLATLGLYMLVAVMLFALAGAFTRNSQWSWKMTIVMSYFTAGVVIGLTIPGFFNVHAGAILVVFCALIIVDLMFPSTKRWFTKIEC